MKKYAIAFFLLSISLIATAQSSDEEADRKDITEVIQNYFDGMLQRDKSKLDKAFHQDARLIGYRGYRFTITPYLEWASITGRGEARPEDTHINKLLNIEIKGYTAIATTELFWPGVYYYDYLTLLRINNQWKIVNKTWYEEAR